MKTAKELGQQKPSRTALPTRWSGGQLVTRRRVHGLSLRDVADATGTTVSGINKIENGIATPSVITALRLAQFYETTVEDLFGELTTMPLRADSTREFAQ